MFSKIMNYTFYFVFLILVSFNSYLNYGYSSVSATGKSLIIIDSYNKTIKTKGIAYENGVLTLYCVPIRKISEFNKVYYINLTLPQIELNIRECIPENYAEELKYLGINISTIKRLGFTYVAVEPLPHENHTEGLTIPELSLFGHFSLYESAPKFLNPLSELTSLKSSGIELPNLPNNMHLLSLILDRGASIKSWGNCQYLQRFVIIAFNEEDFPVWPRNCTKLVDLEIDNNSVEVTHMIIERMRPATRNLISLKLVNCRLTKLPIDFLKFVSYRLKHLNLSNNYLEDRSFNSFPQIRFENLITLDVSNNRLHRYNFNYLPKNLRKLKELYFKDQTSYDASECYGFAFDFDELEYINFGKTPLSSHCLEESNNRNLKYIYITLTTNVLDISKFSSISLRHLTVEFGNDRFDRILYTVSDYNDMRRKLNLTILLKEVKCDCNLGWYLQVLEDYPHSNLSMPNTRCQSQNGIGNKILEEPIEHLKCNATEDNGWYYRQSWNDGIVTAGCNEEAWNKMKPIFPIHSLNVSGQGISLLHSNLPKTIKRLDLRNNQISHGSAEETEELFAENRQVWLSGNSLLCDCGNRALLDAIEQHRDQVKDYDLLKCVYPPTGEVVSLISTTVLCQTALVASLSVSGVLVGIVGLTALLLRWYGKPIRVYLYSRGLCISCLRKPEIDDKPYDAFISFAHEDRDFVMNTLLPGLEDSPEKFCVCVHYRDWVVGDWIPAQIMRSVQQSKRTIILLSRNFVASPWSTLEFRYASVTAAEEPNVKVMVLILDDVLEMDLNIDLQYFLKYNTYLRCDDEWFWEKLRYAMPHRSKADTQRRDNIDMNMTIRHDDARSRNPNVAIAFPSSAENVE